MDRPARLGAPPALPVTGSIAGRVERRPGAAPVGAGRPRLDGLTGLRFVAAAWVVVFHFGQVALAATPPWVRAVADSGYAGVDLFFVLSGFVLAYAYLGDGRAAAVNARRFWAARVARVYPVYLVALGVSVPFIGPLDHWQGWLGAVPALAQAWWPAMVQTAPWNPPGWSLSAEVFFYALFPLIAPALTKVRRRGLTAVAAAAWLVSVTGALLYVLGRLDGAVPRGYSAFWALAAERGSRSWGLFFTFWPPLRLPEFVLGCVLGILFIRRASRRRRCDGWLAGGAAAAVVGALALGVDVPYLLLSKVVLLPLFAVLIYGLAGGGGPLAWVLSRPQVVLLGEASYALYVLQWPIRDWTASYGPSALGLGLYLCALVAVAVVVYVAIERPLREPLRDWLGGGRAARRRSGGVGAPAPARRGAPGIMVVPAQASAQA